jgi:hypothetical protein
MKSSLNLNLLIVISFNFVFEDAGIHSSALIVVNRSFLNYPSSIIINELLGFGGNCVNSVVLQGRNTLCIFAT